MYVRYKCIYNIYIYIYLFFYANAFFRYNSVHLLNRNYIFNRVGPDIRQCRIIRPDCSFFRISGRIFHFSGYPACRIIRHPAYFMKNIRHPAKKNRSGPTQLISWIRSDCKQTLRHMCLGFFAKPLQVRI